MIRPGPTPNGPRRDLSADVLVGLLAEGDRLSVVAALVLGASSLAEVEKATGLDGRRVQRAIERLAGVGLVRRGGSGGYEVAAELFATAAQEAARSRPAGPTPEDLGASPEAASVLRNFMRDGRLISIPTARRKRLLVLDFLSSQFEPGRVYPEREVNFTLAKFHADVAALRRYLVDEEFLERRDGFYWRVGGTVDVE